MKKRRSRLSLCEPDFSRDRILNLPLNRLDELVTFWKLEGAGIAKGAAITIWRFKPITNQIVSTMGTTITIWRFTANDQSIVSTMGTTITKWPFMVNDHSVTRVYHSH